MKQATSTKHYLLFSIAIILTKFISMGDFAIYPITNEFYNIFPGKEAIVNYIISGPQLIIMAMAFVVPLLSKKFTKKTLMIFALMFFGIGSLLSVAIVDPIVMAVGRTLTGIGHGILSITSVSIVADVILDPNQQFKYVGIFNASGNAAAMLLSLGAGVLAVYSWKHPFLLYLVAVPTLLAVIFFVPNGSVENTSAEVAAKEKTSLGMEFWVMAVAAAVFSMLRTIIMYYMSSYVAENALGGTGVAATAASMSQLFAFVGAISFSVVYAKLERWIMPLTCGLMAVALALWNFTVSPVTVFVVYCLACGSSGMFMAYAYAHAMRIVEKNSIDTSIAVLSALCGVAAFVPTYFITFLMKLFAVTEVTPVLVVPLGIGVVLFVVTLAYTFKLKRQKL